MGGNPRLSSTEMGNAPESEPERHIRRLGDTTRVWLGLHHVSGFWTYRSLLGLSSGMSSRIFDRDKSSCMSLTACTTLKTIVHPPVHVADSTDVLLWWSLWFRPVAIWKNKDLSKNMVFSSVLETTASVSKAKPSHYFTETDGPWQRNTIWTMWLKTVASK